MGYHHLPLVSGRPSLETLQQLSTESSSSVLLSVLQNKKVSITKIKFCKRKSIYENKSFLLMD